jgi:hypothetical protein
MRFVRDRCDSGSITGDAERSNPIVVTVYQRPMLATRHLPNTEEVMLFRKSRFMRHRPQLITAGQLELDRDNEAAAMAASGRHDDRSIP